MPTKQEKEQRAVRRGHLERLTSLMSDPVGRSYMYEILAGCNIYTTSFSSNALNMAFAEGERNVGLKLVADLCEACPDRYLQMLKEAGNVRSTGTDSYTSDPSSGDADGETE